jgi:hypothetical protein
MKSKSAVRLGLYVYTEHRDGYFHVNAYPVVLGPTEYELKEIDAGRGQDVPYNRVRNVGDDTIHGLYLKDLRASSQGTDADIQRRLYAWDCEFKEVHSVDRRKADAMAKTLAAIERRTEKLAIRFGGAATFGQYVGRIAEAIGAETFVFADEKQRGGWSYEDNEHTFTTVGEGISRVDWIVRKWANVEKEETTHA